MKREILPIHAWYVVSVDGRHIYLSGQGLSDGVIQRQIYYVSMDLVKGRFCYLNNKDIVYLCGAPLFHKMEENLPDLTFADDILDVYPVQNPLMFLYNVFVWKP